MHKIRQIIKSHRHLFGAEITDVQDLFHAIDKDGSGTIEREEFSKAMTRLGLGLTKPQLEDLWNGLDADGSGTLDYNEMLAKVEAPKLRTRGNSGLRGSPRSGPGSPGTAASDDSVDGVDTPQLDYEIEKLHRDVEKLLLDHHSAQLARWTSEQLYLMHGAAAGDVAVLQEQAANSEACVQAIANDVQEQSMARAESKVEAVECKGQCERHLKAELKSLGDTKAAEVRTALVRGVEATRAFGAGKEKEEWDLIGKSLRDVLWQQSKAHLPSLAPVPYKGIADAHDGGELQAYLDSERDGWARSQRTDLDRLHAEVDGECSDIIASLQERLQDLDPAGLLQPCDDHLSEVAALERSRMLAVESETVNTFKAEINEALVQCEEDYRHMDGELQAILFNTMVARSQSAAAMRQLKLSLCRWRLEYQRAYHEYCARPRHQHHPDHEEPLDDREGTVRLAAMRKLVHRLWARNRVPSAEIHRFVSSLVDSASASGNAEDALAVYEEELRALNALPLLEHADRPELLDCWLQTRKDRKKSGSVVSAQSDELSSGWSPDGGAWQWPDGT